MKVLALDSTLEPVFWRHVSQDIRDYFFITYMKQAREFTEIWIVLGEENHIEGIMAIHRNSPVQLRETFNAPKALIRKLNLEKARV